MSKIQHKILIMLSVCAVNTAFSSTSLDEQLVDSYQVRPNAVSSSLRDEAGFCYKVKDAIFAKIVQFGMNKSLEMANEALPAPQDEDLQSVVMEPFGWGLDNVYCAANPPSAEQSWFAKYSKKAVAWLMSKMSLNTNVQIPLNHQDMLDACLPEGHRALLVKFGFAGGKPKFPIEMALNTSDLVAARALLSGDVKIADASVLPAGLPGSNTYYEIDLLNYAAYPVKEGLDRLGGRAVMTYNATRGFMETIAMQTEPGGTWITRDLMGDAVWSNAQKRMMAAMLTDTTFNEHLGVAHLAVSATISSLVYQLPKDHPMRRMLHMHTIGAIPVNKYNVPLLLDGEGAFFSTISSYNLTTIQQIMNDHLKGFDFNMLNPHLNLARRGMADASFAYPYADNAKRIWDLTAGYVGRYVDHYYPEHSLVRDEPMQDWYVNVLKYLPNANSTLPRALTRDGLVNLLTGFIYSDSFGHHTTGVDIINWGAWANLVPAKVYSDGSRPRIGDVTQTLNLLCATQPTERLTMSADNFSQFALDMDGKLIMNDFAVALRSAMPDAVIRASVYS